MKVLETERLILRPFTLDDAAFIYELVNQPAWKRYIGDRGVDSLAAARTFHEAHAAAVKQLRHQLVNTRHAIQQLLHFSLGQHGG